MPITYNSYLTDPTRPKRRWTLMSGYNDPNQLSDEELYRLQTVNEYNKGLQQQANDAAMARLGAEMSGRSALATSLADKNVAAQKELATLGHQLSQDAIKAAMERVAANLDIAGVDPITKSIILSDVTPQRLVEAKGLPQRMADEPDLAKRQGNLSRAELEAGTVGAQNVFDEANAFAKGGGPGQLGMQRAYTEPRMLGLGYDMRNQQRIGQQLMNATTLQELLDRQKLVNQTYKDMLNAAADQKSAAYTRWQNAVAGRGTNFETPPKGKPTPSGGSMVGSFGGGPSAGLSNAAPATVTAPSAPLTAPQQQNGLPISPEVLDILKLLNTGTRTF